MSRYSTGAIDDALVNCSDIEEFRSRVIPMLSSQRRLWTEKLESIMTDNSLSVKEMASLCRVSEPAVRKWMKGSIPQSRDMYIRIAFAAGYGVEETNVFLRRCGCCPELYPRSLEDLSCIFVLRLPKERRSYAEYTELLELLRRELEGEKDNGGVNYTTMELSRHIEDMEKREEMAEFVRGAAESFRVPYAKLYNFILAFLEINLMDAYGGSSASFNAMAEESGWSSSLRHCITDIRRGRWFPFRHKLISLGLHLNMDSDDIDRMLGLARMEPLYSRNPVEAAVKFAINEARLMSMDDEIIQDGSNDLCLFVKDILLDLDLGESDYLTDDL